jgi:ABC-type phosphate transport system substrate-binding protein
MKVFLLVLLFGLLVACGQTEILAPTVVSTTTLPLIAEDYPDVDGSTSAHPLQTKIACHILGVECKWWEEGWLFDSTRRILPVEESFEDSLEYAEYIFNIQHNGTHGSYVNLIEGAADIILVARLPSDDELLLAQESGVTLDIQSVALDAFVFLVNTGNDVDDLPLDTIQDIYTGEITLWGEVGGGEGVIQPYQRNRNSGSQELMENLVMQGTPMIDSPDMILEGMMGPINAISGDTMGIGYSVYFYAVYMFPNDYVKLIGVNGVYPTPETIADGSYSLATKVYVVIREGTPAGSTAVMLRDWLLTAEGQVLVAESGYVPVR